MLVHALAVGGLKCTFHFAYVVIYCFLSVVAKWLPTFLRCKGMQLFFNVQHFYWQVGRIIEAIREFVAIFAEK